jgi:tetratricopeptide (TPR) repeat protein
VNVIKLLVLIIILLIVILFVLFYSPKKSSRRRRAVVPVSPEFQPELIAEGDAGGEGAREAAAGPISEIPAAAVAEVEPELELILEMPEADREEELTLEFSSPLTPEAEEPMMPAPEMFSVDAEPAEEIPFIDEEEPGLPRHAESEVAPALAGFSEDAGPAPLETPEDLANRLDLFFGGEEDAGIGPEAEGPAGQEAGGLLAEPAAEEVAAEKPAVGVREEAAALTLEEYATCLRRLEEELRQELTGAIAARETGKFKLLESRLTAVCSKLADPADSLVRHNQLLEEISGLLTEISEVLPGFQTATVRSQLRSGDAEVVRALLTEAALQVAAISPLAARLRFGGGRLAEEQADFAAAGELYQQACAGGARNPEHLYAAGRMARILGNEEEARQLLEEALAAGGDSDAQDLSRYELALIHLSAEQTDKAEPLLQQALAGLSERLGADHPALGPVLHELAALHESAGQYEQAAPLYERALAVSEQGLGQGHPRLAATLSRLAGLYEEMEQEERAEPLYARAMAIRKQVLGASHPEVGILLNSLANLLKQRGDYGKAEPMFLSSLEIAEKALGADHPNLTVILNNLAELYEEMGNGEKAQQYQARAFALFELPGAGGDFVEMEKEEVEVDDHKGKTITGG